MPLMTADYSTRKSLLGDPTPNDRQVPRVVSTDYSKCGLPPSCHRGTGFMLFMTFGLTNGGSVPCTARFSSTRVLADDNSGSRCGYLGVAIELIKFRRGALLQSFAGIMIRVIIIW